MNVFYLSEHPDLAARMQCDQHCNKMLLESCQLLSTAHHLLGSTAEYAPTHQNHPSAVWVRSNVEHYIWLQGHAIALANEYQHRFGKRHKCKSVAEALEQWPKGIPIKYFESPPLAMPEQYKTQCAVASYRDYYLGKAREWFTSGKTMRYNRLYTVNPQTIWDNLGVK